MIASRNRLIALKKLMRQSLLNLIDWFGNASFD